jgi:hypothetical protein
MYHAISDRLTQSIFAIAVAQLPPPITANFGDSFILVHLKNQKYSFLMVCGLQNKKKRLRENP